LEPPTYEKVNRSLLNLRNNKEPGTDGIPAELLKNGGPHLTQKLYHIIHRIWEEEQMPEEWNNGIICPILKKGDPLECGNYIGINLLNVAYKILSNIPYTRLLKVLEPILGNNQCGFRPGKCNVNQIFTLSQIIQKNNGIPDRSTPSLHTFQSCL
jgi:hypothetical protein